MKIHFVASSVQLEELHDAYEEIMRVCEAQGHEVITLYDYLNVSLEEIMSWSGGKMQSLLKEWLDLIGSVDIGVIESSFPSSINVGAVISAMLEQGKPVVSIYKKEREAVALDALYSKRMVRVAYGGVKDIHDNLCWALDEAELSLQRRFTLNISGEIDAFLEKSSELSGTSKSEFIRGLIEREMDRD